MSSRVLSERKLGFWLLLKLPRCLWMGVGWVCMEKEGRSGSPVISSVQPQTFFNPSFPSQQIVRPNFPLTTNITRFQIQVRLLSSHRNQLIQNCLILYCWSNITDNNSVVLQYIYAKPSLLQSNQLLSGVIPPSPPFPQPGSVPTVSEGVVSSTACINQVRFETFG